MIGRSTLVHFFEALSATPIVCSMTTPQSLTSFRQPLLGFVTMPDRRDIALYFAIVTMLSSPFGLMPQETTLLSEGCPRCRIVVDTVVILGDPDGPGMIEDDFTPTAVDGLGRYYLLSNGGSSIKVFAPDGMYLHTLGGRGEGPGEFQLVRRIHIDADDRLFTTDRLLGRISIFASTGTLERTVTVPEPLLGFTVFPIRGDSILVGGHSFTPALIGYSTHILSPEGTRIRSFGEPTYPLRPSSDEFYHHRAIAPADLDQLWIAGWERYQIELWSLDGTRLHVWHRDADWFHRADPATDGRTPPRPSLTSLYEDSSGRLWLHMRVAAEDWLDGPERFDTVIEVLDPEAGEVLASLRLSGRTHELFGNRMISQNVVDLESQSVASVVIQLDLERP
jgi:hypothetical protein